LLAALVAVPILSAVALLFTVDGGVKQRLKYTPFSFRTEVWYNEEKKMRKKYVLGYIINNFMTTMLSYYLWNIGNIKPLGLITGV